MESKKRKRMDYKFLVYAFLLAFALCIGFIGGVWYSNKIAYDPKSCFDGWNSTLKSYSGVSDDYVKMTQCAIDRLDAFCVSDKNACRQYLLNGGC